MLIPQMSPMMWFTLFILFSATMILFNQMLFFSFKPNKINISKNKSTNNQMNWKW
uniref:ATP synthase complex subunit 8 n=1 Tax=Chrotogonus sp. TAMUIC IGC OR284 TaxID=2591243 RepID=A0A516IMX0_9ORTH|nr:ATP synthase F0 subunit 8 [Chrotogonus sp. TAMUIC IGC OR284]